METKELITAKDFYDFFDAIPQEEWTQNELTIWISKGKWCHCANYWLGVRNTPLKCKQKVYGNNGGGYGTYSQLEHDNVLRLAELLEGKPRIDFSSATVSIYYVNDNIKDFNEPFNKLTENIKGKLAKHNMLKALKQIIDSQS